MAAPQHRRPLPAVVFIGVLTVLTVIVWVRVLDRGTGTGSASPSSCTTPAPVRPTVLPYATQVSVIVLNSTDRANLAGHTKLGLRKDHFKVVQAANDEPSYGGHGEIAGVGEIRFGPTATRAAIALHYFLPRATLVHTDSSSPTVILALGKAFKHLVPRPEALQLMHNAGASQTSATPPPPPAPTPSC